MEDDLVPSISDMISSMPFLTELDLMWCFSITPESLSKMCKDHYSNRGVTIETKKRLNPQPYVIKQNPKANEPLLIYFLSFEQVRFFLENS